MSDLLPFTYEDYPVRILQIDGEPWFVGTDVARLLGYSNPSDACRSVDQRDQQTATLALSEGSREVTRERTLINESALYELTFGSTLPTARDFKRWVTGTVLPQIRKTGAYGTPALPDLTSLEGISAILDAGKAALNRAQAAEARALELEGPAAERDLYRSSAGLQLIGDVANRFKAYAADRWPDLKVKHEDVWDHAGRLGIVIRGNTVRHNQPTAQAIENGWAKPAESLIETYRHGTKRAVHTRLTVKGETRLWDGLVAYVTQRNTLTISKEIAA